MNFQLKNLQRLCPSELRFKLDLLTDATFYGRLRLLVHAPELAQAYRLLYPRDQRVIGHQVLAITGLPGIACLWMDCGRREGQAYWLSHRSWSQADCNVIADWLNTLGFPASAQPGKILLERTQEDSLLPDAISPVAHLIHPGVRRLS